MAFIKLNLNELIRNLLPTKFKLKNFDENNLWQCINSFLKPNKDLYADLLTYREDSLYEINHNGQVLSLEHILNERFGLPFPAGLGSILLSDSYWLESPYIFNSGIDWDSNLNDKIIYSFNDTELPETNNIILNDFPISTVNGEYQESGLVNGETGYEKISDTTTKLEWSGSRWEIFKGATIYYIANQNKDPRYITIWLTLALASTNGYVINNTYTYSKTEYDVDSIDFIVNIPIAVYSVAENRSIITSYLNKYKVAGNQFELSGY